VRRPVTVAHGREDDVIPFEHAARLAAALPHAEVHVTGLYDHTGPRRPATLVAEARALVGVVAGIAAAACRIER
jgi:pimeloyl-ACP methyl ester carboxylesterase